MEEAIEIGLDAPERGSAAELMDHGASGELGPMRHSAAHVLAEAVMELFPVAAYVRQVRPLLPAEAFAPARSRALWIPVHYAIIVALIWALATGHVPWPLWPVVSLVIGGCMAGVTFVAHEALHGGVVRGRALLRVVGWLGFLPFCISPQLWMA